jgi:hypothetical protein
VISFIRAWLKKRRHRAIEALPSRIYLQTDILSALAAAGCRRLLFVGAQSYNFPFYRACEALGVSVWSIDFDPTAARYGAPQGHFSGDICNIASLAGPLKFDAIIFNGVFGFGINTASQAIAAVEAMAKVAEKDAILVIGWNPGRTDGQEIAAVRPRLIQSALGKLPGEVEFPARGRAQRNPHRYETFKFGDTPP